LSLEESNKYLRKENSNLIAKKDIMFVYLEGLKKNTTTLLLTSKLIDPINEIWSTPEIRGFKEETENKEDPYNMKRIPDESEKSVNFKQLKLLFPELSE
jgi:hypothetical protein